MGATTIEIRDPDPSGDRGAGLADVADGEPPHLQLARRIAERIRAGAWGARERLPDERALMATWGASRVMVRGAIRELVRQGLVESKQGRGTCVADPVIRQDLTEFRTVFQTLADSGHQPVGEVLDFASGQPAGPRLRAAAATAARTARRFLVDGRPVALVLAEISETAGPIAREQFERAVTPGGLHELVGTEAPRSDVDIRAARFPAVARKALRMGPGAFGLVMERVVYRADGRPCMVATTYARPDAYAFALSVGGGGPASASRPRRTGAASRAR